MNTTQYRYPLEHFFLRDINENSELNYLDHLTFLHLYDLYVYHRNRFL
jgi:hypothetical protein